MVSCAVMPVSCGMKRWLEILAARLRAGQVVLSRMASMQSQSALT